MPNYKNWRSRTTLQNLRFPAMQQLSSRRSRTRESLVPLSLLLRRLFFVAPVKSLHDQEVDKQANEKQKKKENDQPRERGHQPGTSSFGVSSSRLVMMPRLSVCSRKCR